MTRLILHIGTEKTGTTSLQRWASTNRHALYDQGVFYSRELGETNHRKISLAVLRADVWEGNAAATDLAGYPTERDAFRTAVKERFAREVAQATAKGAQTVFISNEHCHSRLTTPQEVQALHELVTSLFDDIRVVCFLRPQIEMALSLTSTAARAGNVIDSAFFDRVSADAAYFDYGALVRRWAGVFGQDVLVMVPFKKFPDSIAYFADLLGLNTAVFKQPERANEALDIRAMSLSNMVIRAGQGSRKGTAPAPAIPFDAMPQRERLRLSRRFAEDVQARVAASNAQLLRDNPCMTAFEPDDLTPDWSRYDDSTNIDVLDQDDGYGEHILAILSRYESRDRLLRAREAVALAERAQLGGSTRKDAFAINQGRSGHGTGDPALATSCGIRIGGDTQIKRNWPSATKRGIEPVQKDAKSG